MRQILHLFLESFFPSRSLEGVEGEWMTEGELRQLRRTPLVLEGDALLAKGVEHVDRLVAASDFRSSPLLRAAVHRFKYRGVRDLAEPLAELLVEPASRLAAGDNAVLCPVPLHWTREFLRGFNQCRLLADALSSQSAWRVLLLLKRRRATGTQTKREKNGRWEAMRDVFVPAATALPEHVILIDDVATTGATLEHCARVLKHAGVRRVDALVLACA